MTTSSNSKPSRGKTILIGFIIVVFIAIGLYVAGFLKGRSQTGALQAQLTQTQAQLVTSQNRGYLMEARAAVYFAGMDLDQRNFGKANDHLQEAARTLSEIKQNADTVDSPAITQIQSSIEALNINVAVNLEVQRKQILNLATQLDGVVNENSPK